MMPGWLGLKTPLSGPEASGYSSDQDGELGDVGFTVDADGCSQAENTPIKAI